VRKCISSRRRFLWEADADAWGAADDAVGDGLGEGLAGDQVDAFDGGRSQSGRHEAGHEIPHVDGADGGHADRAEGGDDVLAKPALDVGEGLGSDVGLGGEPLGGVLVEADLAEPGLGPLASELGVLDADKEALGVDPAGEGLDSLLPQGVAVAGPPVKRLLAVPGDVRALLDVGHLSPPAPDDPCGGILSRGPLVAAATTGAWGSAATVPAADDTECCALLERVLFSKPIGQVGRRAAAELLRAIWLLHESFAQRSENAAATVHDRVLSVSGVLGYSQRPRFAWAERLNHWRIVWETDDQHPTITQNSSATGQQHRPSDLRRVLVDRGGLTVDDLMTGGLGLAAWYFVRVAQGHVPVHRPEVISVSVTDRGRVAQRFMDCVGQHMAATLEAVGVRVLDEIGRQGRRYEGLGSTPTHDGQALADTPLLELPDGSWAPLSLDHLVDRIAVLPRAVAVADGRFGHPRTVNGLVGYMFEAADTTAGRGDGGQAGRRRTRPRLGADSRQAISAGRVGRGRLRGRY
jgi:hypothetical protein